MTINWMWIWKPLKEVKILMRLGRVDRRREWK